MIITLSGPDGSGKTTLTKLLHERLNSTKFYLATNTKFTLINTDWCAPNKFPSDFTGNKFLGFNLALAQMYESMDNFIRDRGALDEYVYANKFNRKEFDWRYLDSSGIEKQITILILPTYSRYLLNVKDRTSEQQVGEGEFNSDVKLFEDAFNQSNVLFKKIIYVDSEGDENTLDNVLDRILYFLIPILTFNTKPTEKFVEILRYLDQPKFVFEQLRFKFFQSSIMQCKQCKLHSECSSVNPTYCRPILPKLLAPTLSVQNLFIGVGPGRGGNNEVNIECFSHASGGYLTEVIRELSLEHNTAITNIIKCNTPQNKSFFNENTKESETCFSRFLFYEITSIYPNLRNIIVMGNQAQIIFRKNVEKNSYLSSKISTLNILNVRHPAAIIYSKNQIKAYEEWRSELWQLNKQI